MDETVAVKEPASEDGIEIYPNPFTDKFSVKLAGNKQATSSIEIRNAMGGIVFEKLSFHGDLMNIDLSGFARGLYIVKIEDGRKSSTRKVLKVE